MDWSTPSTSSLSTSLTSFYIVLFGVSMQRCSLGLAQNSTLPGNRRNGPKIVLEQKEPIKSRPCALSDLATLLLQPIYRHTPQTRWHLSHTNLFSRFVYFYPFVHERRGGKVETRSWRETCPQKIRLSTHHLVILDCYLLDVQSRCSQGWIQARVGLDGIGVSNRGTNKGQREASRRC